ncbi:hypothetical protein D3C78_1403530 [compost metagenome]
MYAADLFADFRQQDLRLAGDGHGLACVLLARGVAAVRSHHPGALAGADLALQPDSLVGLDRFHHHRGRAGTFVRMAEPGHLSGGAGADPGRHRGQQFVGA